MKIKGKYAEAEVFINNLEQETVNQIIELCNQELAQDTNIRIMPDAHAGAGCVIGTTMCIKDKIIPNIVGVDIGCGMLVLKLDTDFINLEKLDKIIKENIPSGKSVRNERHKYAYSIGRLLKAKRVDTMRGELSIGTLGGGNHFIEVNKDDEGCLYLVIHSGSRNIGKQTADYYQELAYKTLTNNTKQKQAIIDRLLKEGKKHLIQKALEKVDKPNIPKGMAYVEGASFDNYIHDMGILQEYAMVNRNAIAETILEKLDIRVVEKFQTIHNYIDMETMILRKGAVRANKDERLIIPMNMRDGSLICIGKGNEDWNYSAPHGAGRTMSRKKAKESIKMEDFVESMDGIYSSCITPGTLDESPMAYKPMEDIIDNIGDTVSVEKIIKPVYNFKGN